MDTDTSSLHAIGATVWPRDVPSMATKAILSFLRRTRLRPKKLYLPALGQMVYDPREICDPFQEIFVSRSYLPLKPLRSAARIIDIGAHYGLFTLWALRNLPVGQIDAFEPNRNSYRILRANIDAANKAGVVVRTHQAAAALTDGTACLFVPVARDSSTRATICAAHQEPAADLLEVSTVSIEKIIGDRCDYLKIDAEGIEYEVLAHPIVSPSRVGEIVAEIHDIHRRQGDFLSLTHRLVDRGYRVSDTRGVALFDADLKALSANNNGGAALLTVLHFS